LRRARETAAALALAIAAAGAASATAAAATTTHHTGTRTTRPTAKAASASSAPTPDCSKVDGNLVRNCDFAQGIDGWEPQAATTFRYEAKAGNHAPGALEMTNEPASEAGAGTCAPIGASGTFELSGYLRRLVGTGECLAWLEEHTSPDCSGGATHFHEMVSIPLHPSAFTRVSGSSPIAADTASLKAGFACYGEHDDDVSGVLVDDVVLRKTGG
jgi:hypothetical protein